MIVIAGVERFDVGVRWVARPLALVLRERLWSVGRIEDALASRLWGSI